MFSQLNCLSSFSRAVYREMTIKAFRPTPRSLAPVPETLKTVQVQHLHVLARPADIIV